MKIQLETESLQHEFYFYIGRDGFFFAVRLFDIDFELHLANLRNHVALREYNTEAETQE